ncbi:hypothetical protein A7X67_01130 [Clostridium sp. W14A]|nr:hypothetical protein A7X67_01130 [Clostridium sp. W14A]
MQGLQCVQLLIRSSRAINSFVMYCFDGERVGKREIRAAVPIGIPAGQGWRQPRPRQNVPASSRRLCDSAG